MSSAAPLGCARPLPPPRDYALGRYRLDTSSLRLVVPLLIDTSWRRARFRRLSNWAPMRPHLLAPGRPHLRAPGRPYSPTTSTPATHRNRRVITATASGFESMRRKRRPSSSAAAPAVPQPVKKSATTPPTGHDAHTT